MSDNTFTASVFYQDPKAALAWLERAFGFEITMLIESPDGDVRMMHSEMAVGGRGRLMVGAEWSEWAKSPRSVGGANTQSLHVDLEEDVDAHCARAREAGATIVAEPENQFYGMRTYRAVDPEGHVWTFGEWVEEMPSREAAEKASGLKIEAKDWD
ncbi:MAG TPA: VOC family protein [Gammaproteobacteria bacterium]|nr:VOC family protein [Gammaproteobacteria bacterium]